MAAAQRIVETRLIVIADTLARPDGSCKGNLTSIVWNAYAIRATYPPGP